MKLVSGTIDFSGWGFEIENIDGLIAAAITETIRNTFDENPPLLLLPFLWVPGGEGGQDPLALRVSIALGPDNDEPTFESSLREIVFEMIDGNEDDPMTIEAIASFAAALRTLADELQARAKS